MSSTTGNCGFEGDNKIYDPKKGNLIKELLPYKVNDICMTKRALVVIGVDRFDSTLGEIFQKFSSEICNFQIFL